MVRQIPILEVVELLVVLDNPGPSIGIVGYIVVLMEIIAARPLFMVQFVPLPISVFILVVI
jgi:hypothetical protein